MERRRFIQGAGLAGILSSGMAPAVVMAQRNVRWRLASSYPRSLDTLFGVSEDFARNVADLTDGAFQIDVSAGGEIVPALSVFDAVQNGTVEMAHAITFYFIGKNEAFAFDAILPFGMNARMMNAWMYDGGGLQLLREIYARYGIFNFPLGNTGTQWGGWYRKEIRSVEDLKGLKMRMGNMAGHVLGKLGAVSQAIPGGEVYQALEKGTIDAVEWSSPYDDQKLGFHRVAPYGYYPAWWEGSAQVTLLVNAKSYESLPKVYQEAIRIATTDAHTRMLAKYDARNPEALRRLIAEGAKIQRMPKEVMDAAFKASREVFAEFEAKSEDFRRLNAHYQKFLRDEYAWFRLSELSYDQYMAGLPL